jgi:hypothetical protein
VAAETLQRVYSPEKNTSRESRKRYYEEVDHDKDSEEEFKLPIEGMIVQMAPLKIVMQQQL